MLRLQFIDLTVLHCFTFRKRAWNNYSDKIYGSVSFDKYHKLMTAIKYLINVCSRYQNDLFMTDNFNLFKDINKYIQRSTLYFFFQCTSINKHSLNKDKNVYLKHYQITYSWHLNRINNYFMQFNNYLCRRPLYQSNIIILNKQLLAKKYDPLCKYYFSWTNHLY